MRSKDMKRGQGETKRYDLSMDMLDSDEIVTLEWLLGDAEGTKAGGFKYRK